MYIPDPEQEKKAIINRYRKLLNVWTPTNAKDRVEVRKAFNLAADAHKNMRRRTGEPYIYHPLEVARIVAGEIGLGKTSIICALLHDVVEDTDYTRKDIENKFGPKVSKIIDGLTKIKGIFEKKGTSVQAENFKRMLLTLSDDVRVILIKLADRLHNMRTLDAMPEDKQLKIASETSYFYAPIAHRFGLFNIKSELEDLSLKYTEPEIYNSISQKLQISEKERKRIANKFIFPIKKALSEKQFNYKIIFRNKSIFSIWNKMKSKGIPFEDVFDIMAIRIIVDTPEENEKVDCWRVYSIITDHYRPKIDRLRDWISIPKANGYEALHTTVMNNNGQWVEVQVRTKRMDEIAERGYAAHWRYKSVAGVSERSINNWLERIKEMLHSNDSSALDFIDDFQGFLFTHEIYVFTPKGELRNLPKDSTVLDFAYAIHSEIGNKCIGAKVNHKLAPLNSKLNSGDQVEILTSKKQTPKEEWFYYVVTARAKTKIKHGIKEEKKKYKEEGKEKLSTIFKQLNIDLSDKSLQHVMRKYNYSSPLDLYYEIAIGLIGIKEIKDCAGEGTSQSWLSKMIKRPFTRTRQSDKKKTLTESVLEELAKRKSEANKEKVEKISYDISNCCHPIPGDEVMGFIHPNEDIEMHRTNCSVARNKMSKFGNQIIKTTWNDKETIGFLAGIIIHGIDRKGFINDIVRSVTETFDTDIKSIQLDTNGGVVEAKIMIYVYSTRNLEDLINIIGKTPDVSKVSRLSIFN